MARAKDGDKENIRRESAREREERERAPIKNSTIHHILERVRARGDSERERRREREGATAQAII